MKDLTSPDRPDLQQTTSYDPDRLLDEIAKTLGAANDAALSQKLNISRTVVRQLRLRHLSITPSFLMWLHEASGVQIQKLRDLLGDRRKRVRPSGQYCFGASSGRSA